MGNLNAALEVVLGDSDDLRLFASLSSCSRDFRERAATVISQRITTLLPSVVTNALLHLASAKENVLRWFCNKAGSAVATQWHHCEHAIVSIPDIPDSIASILVAAGARVSLKQLQAACSKQIAGVEVWVKACRELGLDTKLPATVEAVCCNNIQALKQALLVDYLISEPPAEAMLDLVDIALNMKSSTAAEYLLDTYSSSLRAVVHSKRIFQQLETAILRCQPHPLMFYWIESEHMQDTVDYGHGQGYRRRVARLLCSYPAAQQLGPADVIKLMYHALRHGGHIFHILRQLPGALEITAEQLDALLLSCTGLWDGDLLAELVCIPTAVDPETWLTVLVASREAQSADISWQLTPTRTLNGTQTAALMVASLQGPTSDTLALHMIEHVSGAELLTTTEWVDVLRIDVATSDYHHDNADFAREAWKVPVVQQLERGDVAQLLQQAVLLRRQKHLSDDFVALLTTDQKPNAVVLAKLLKTALLQRDHDMLCHICQQRWAADVQQQLPAGSPTAEVIAAMWASSESMASSSGRSTAKPSSHELMTTNHETIMQVLPAYVGESLEARLHAAIAVGDCDEVEFLGLCSQGAACELGAESVELLLASAVATIRDSKCNSKPPVTALVEAIYKLLVDTDADVTRIVVEQLGVAVCLRRDAAAAALCGLHSLQLSPWQSEDLLRRAVQMGCQRTQLQLCAQESVQNGIGHKAAYRLMVYAVAASGAKSSLYAPECTLEARVQVVEFLLGLPAVKGLTAQEIASLMNIAVHTQPPASTMLLKLLASIPAVQQLDRDAVDGLYKSVLWRSLLEQLLLLPTLLHQLPFPSEAVLVDVVLQQSLLMGSRTAEMGLQLRLKV